MRPIKALPLVILVIVAFSAHPMAQAPAQEHAVSAQILVKFRPGANGATKADAHRVAGGRMLREISRTGVQLVSVAAGDETGAINRYRRNPNVLYAERNVVRSIPKPVSNAKLSNHIPGSEPVPGDFYFKEQWALHNTGQEFVCIPWIFGPLCLYIGTPDADIDAPEAWAISTGSTVLVAVIDTGIDYTHPDLMINYAGGFDFVNNDSDPMDDHGHGTHVSGTIAASLGNVTGDPAAEEGVVGVAPHARIRAYKVCDATGNCDDFTIQQAIAQAVEDGAKVINMSLGGPEESQALNDAIQDAWNAGLVIVAGAGNDGNQNLFYPAAFPNVISVGAFDEDHRRASFSNYGSWVDISAPGNVIMSSYLMSECGGSSGIPGDSGCYNWLSGTSMATPHVSGAAALVWSRGDVSTNQQVVDIILNSADPQGVQSEARLDSWTAHGGLNIHNALSLGLTNLSPIANAGPDQTVVDTGADNVESVTLDGSQSSDPDGSIVTYEWREGSTFVAFGATPSVFLSVGTHTLTLQVTDDHGATASDTVAITVRANQPPVANAGPDQTVVDSGNDNVESVTLNGSNSSDPDGSIVTYEWREGSTFVASGATPSVSLSVGVHTLTLQVTDDRGATASDTVAITVRANQPPVANAGPDQTVVDNGGDSVESVTLNGSNSSDPDGSIVTYEWREGVTFVASGATPSVLLSVGVHTLTLQVTDDRGATASDTVAITVRANQPPVANAGPDQILTDTGGDGSEAVVLNGSASSDPDGTIVSYVWRKGATVIALGVTPAPVSLPVGVHTITLQVTDDRGVSASDTVDIAINAAPPPPPPPTMHVGDLDGSSIGNKNMWSATLTVTVHNTNHQPVAGATVTGAWSGALTTSGACTTGSDGKCVITSDSVRKRDSAATFTVGSISATGLSYVAANNHDPESDSTGTVIMIAKP